MGSEAPPSTPARWSTPLAPGATRSWRKPASARSAWCQNGAHPDGHRPATLRLL